MAHKTHPIDASTLSEPNLTADVPDRDDLDLAGNPTLEPDDLTTVRLHIDQVRPYWRNPRKITPEAVAAVKDSIARYGYNQPIVVDTEHVVIVGHTRLRALRELGWTEVPVLIRDLTPEQAKEYRVQDNRSGEYSEWDEDKLLLELREWENLDRAAETFPDLDLHTEFAAGFQPITDEQVNKAVKRISPDTIREEGGDDGQPAEPGRPAVPPTPTTKVLVITCPNCLETVEVDPGTR